LGRRTQRTAPQTKIAGKLALKIGAAKKAIGRPTNQKTSLLPRFVLPSPTAGSERRNVTDFHFNKRWFDWLLHRAPPYDLLVMSGDMLDRANATPHRKQIAWVSVWINDHPRPICVCSGNHDLEWDSESERWTPTYGLRDLVNPKVWIHGQRVELNGLSILNIGCTTRPKGGEADIWVAHAPPTKTLVATRPNGGDGGNPHPVVPVRRYAPRLVLAGHVHNPIHWLDFNPGRR
jgi:Icc-related predicted phosphoesterase